MSTSPTSVITYFEGLPDSFAPDNVFVRRPLYSRFDLDFQHQYEEYVNRKVAKRVKEMEEIIKAQKEETIEVAQILMSVANAK